jgi:hypothetical protein
MTSTELLGPIITRIAGSKGDIPEGGTTEETMVTIIGTGTPGRIVNLFDSDHVIGGVNARENGDWSFPWSGVAEGRHEITAKTAREEESPARTFTVKAP